MDKRTYKFLPPFILLLAWGFSFVATFSLFAADDKTLPKENIPNELRAAGIEEKLGSDVDIQHLQFKDENGADVKLAQYFGGSRPVLLSLIYFQCPNLCNYLMNGVSNSVRTLNWSAGKEFDIITVSIDPREGPSLAKAKKAAYLAQYGRFGAANGWHFLTGTDEQIHKLAEQVGFHYFYDKQAKQYAHSAGLFVLTPTGKISRVLYGIDFPNRDLKLSLLEASDGKVGTIFDRILMFCYQYNPSARGYAIYGMRIVRIGGLVTVFILGTYLFWFWRRQRYPAPDSSSFKKNDDEPKRRAIG